MSESLKSNADLIKLYIRNGDEERSKAVAEEIIRDNPEDFRGYILMSYHYYLLKQQEETLDWIDEALVKGPEEELAIEFALEVYQEFQVNEEKRKELIERGLHLYPSNHFFHQQNAEINRTVNSEQALASYQEAIRLDPFNDQYLGNYTMLLYGMNQLDEAEKYEQLTLQANPENSIMLLNFAWIAYQLKRYKKAQMLIDEAMRIDPENELIRDHFKKIYPTRNSFVRAKIGMNDILVKLLRYPTAFVWKLFREKIGILLILVIILLGVLGGLYFISRKSFFIILGMYFLILFISSKISKSMLKKVGFTQAEVKNIKKNTKATQKAALKEMKTEVAKGNESASLKNTTLSSEELEDQLSKIWNSANISTIKEQTKDKAAQSNQRTTKPPQTQTKQGALEEHHPPTPSTQPMKEYSNWPSYLMIGALILGSIVRFGIFMPNESQQPEVLPEEKLSMISEAKQELKEAEDKEMIEENQQIVEGLFASIQENDVERIAEFVLEDYEPVILENIDDPFFIQLAEAKIEKVIQPASQMGSFYYLVTNETENMQAIVKVTFNYVTYIYAENWSKTEEEVAEFEEIMESMETDGVVIE